MCSIDLSFAADEFIAAGEKFYKVSVTIKGLEFNEKRLLRIGGKVEKTFSQVFDVSQTIGKVSIPIDTGAVFATLTSQVADSGMMKKFEYELQTLIRQVGL